MSSSAIAARAAVSPFDVCVSADAHWSYDELVCFVRVGLQHGALPAARERLRRLGGGAVGRPWPTLVLAHATLFDDEPQAIRYYESAAEGFVRTGEADGEVLARQNLQSLYRRRGARAAAARQVELAVTAAEASKAPLTMARASVLQASHLMDSGGDVGRAHRALESAERLAFPSGPIGLRREILFLLGRANEHLGRLDEGIDAFERHRALRKKDGSPVDAAAVAFNILNIQIIKSELRPTPSARARLVPMAEAVVAEAQMLERPYIEAQAQRVVGELLRPTAPERAAAHLERCLDMASSNGFPDVRSACVWSLAALEVARDPARAERLSREAIEAIAAHDAGPLLAFASRARLRMVWRTQPEEQAVMASLEALEAIEGLRSTQKDEGIRAELFSSWTRDYYWLTGRLLEAQPPRLGQAFDVGERLRARVLLEHFERAGVSQPSASPVAAQFATLDAVRQSLQASEALLWFSIAPWKDLYGDFGGGAWLVVVTRERIDLHRLATRVELDSQVAALTGLLRQRETPPAAWAPAAQNLGRTLLGEALADVPPQVDKLVIVSDGPLHLLPFEVLRPDSSQPALGVRFEISMVPSATIWLRLRLAGSPPPASDALVFADPDVAYAAVSGDTQLSPLPWARREAEAIARILRLEDGAVHAGGEASEHRLKRSASGRSGVLHLAAHARADDTFPDRSAVFLARGGAGEDGWLQPHDIAALGLRGGLVVLSACESAEGALVSGEGPLSLARAFFAGGAGTVVATRWPLRDDDAAFVMERFYRALASGATVGAALRKAREDVIAAGHSPAAWAGITVLGDAQRVPIAARSGRSVPWLPVVALAVAIAAIGALVARRVRTHRPHPHEAATPRT